MIFGAFLSGAIGLGAIALLMLAIRTSYRIEGVRRGGPLAGPPVYTNIFASLRARPGDAPEVSVLRERLWRLILGLMGLMVGLAILAALGPR